MKVTLESVNKEPRQASGALTLTVAAALLRLAPHPPNFAPIGGMALLSGAKLDGWKAYLVPLIAMVATDPILSYLSGYPAFSKSTPVIYFCFLLSVLLGRLLLRKRPTRIRVASVACLSSSLFFLITNFAVWIDSGMYPHTAAGLALCYAAAIPFFGLSLLGDLFYSSVLFALAELMERKSELRSVSV